MTNVESISFPDVTLKKRLDDYLKKTGLKKSPTVTKAIDEYLQKRGA